MRVTPSALFLSEWMLEHRSIVTGAHVLELGAGLGYNGLASAAMGATEVCLTDYSPTLLHSLKTEVHESIERRLVPNVLSVKRLDWAEEAAALSLDWSRRWTADDEKGRQAAQKVCAAAAKRVSAASTQRWERLSGIGSQMIPSSRQRPAASFSLQKTDLWTRGTISAPSSQLLTRQCETLPRSLPSKSVRFLRQRPQQRRC